MKMAFRLSLLMLIALAGAALLPVNAQEKPEAAEPLPRDKWPEASADFVAKYVKSIKATQRYQYLESLKREKAEAEVEKWRAAAGVETEVKWSSFLIQFLEGEYTNGEVDKKGWAIRQETVYEELGERRFFVLRPDDDGQGYRVSVAALKDLDFKFLEGISIVNPLNRVISRFSAQNEQLSTVIASLCKDAAAGQGNVDFVVRSDASSQIQISMQVSGRSAFQCLSLAARSVGWDIYVNPRLDKDREDPTEFVRDYTVNWDHGLEYYVNREWQNLQGERNPPIATPLDGMRVAFQDGAQYCRTQRYLVMLKPKVKE